MEYDIFITNQNKMFKKPELFKTQKYKTFGEFLYSKLFNKVKNEGIGNGKITKNQTVKEDINNLK